MDNYCCTKCKEKLFQNGSNHSYQNKQNKKLYCKSCATSKQNNNKKPNPETFERVKCPKIKLYKKDQIF